MPLTLDVAAAPPRPSLTGSAFRGARWRAVTALARTEGRRMVGHPIFLAGVTLSLASFAAATWAAAPVLQRDDILTGLALLPLAAATFLLSILSATRSRRHGTDELFDPTPSDPALRTEAHLLAIAWAAGAAVALVGVFLTVELAGHPVGSPSALELLTGPAIVAVAGALGVALARWIPSPVAPLIALVALTSIQFVIQVQLSLSSAFSGGLRERWLALWAPIAVSQEPSREAVIRPAGWHQPYQAGFFGLAAAAAMLRHGPRPRRVAAAAAALTTLAASAVVQLRPPTGAERQGLAALVLHPERFQVCRVLDGVRYCAYPAYAGWIDRWAAGIRPVIAAVPPQARPDGVVVRQDLELWGSDVPEVVIANSVQFAEAEDMGAAIRPRTRWLRGRGEADEQLGMAIVVAALSAGLPRRPQDIRLTQSDIDFLATLQGSKSERKAFLRQHHHGDPFDDCQSLGQARAVVAMFLAAQATPGTERAFRDAVARQGFGLRILSRPDQARNYNLLDERADGTYLAAWSPYAFSLPVYAVPVFNFPVEFGTEDARYAVQLLDRPRGEALQQIRADWDLLTDAATTTEDLVRLLGLRPNLSLNQQLDQQIALAGLTPAEVKAVKQMSAPGTIACP